MQAAQRELGLGVFDVAAVAAGERRGERYEHNDAAFLHRRAIAGRRLGGSGIDLGVEEVEALGRHARGGEDLAAQAREALGGDVQPGLFKGL